ncbi:MAG: hypothetical protein PHT60_07560 [Acidiphilium sp.]|nr:hypothetical protein [Acidiphilium sp.]MDD4935621.1 hypothetical protein [Acidiphilium sp.]
MQRLRPGLAVLAAGLALVATAEVLAPAAPRPPIAPLTLPQEGVAARPVDDTGLISTTTARPLFRPDRRSVAVAVQSDAALPRLSGILIGTALRIAIFTPDSGPARLVRQGSSIGVYRVAAISANAVTLTAPGVRLVLTPRFAGSADAASTADTPLRPRFAPTIQTPGRH